MRLRAAFAPAIKADVAGDRRTVIVFPGFMASDRTTSRLRRSLQLAGFETHGWGLGRNRGIRADTLDRVADQMAKRQIDGPVTLIGWSLGGLVAREYAKRFRPGGQGHHPRQPLFGKPAREQRLAHL